MSLIEEFRIDLYFPAEGIFQCVRIKITVKKLEAK